MSRRDSFINQEAVWKPDEDSQICDRCQEKFTFLSRRHHCRCCGNIFCQKCSANFALYDTRQVKIVKNPEYYWEYPPYRTCDACFQILRSQDLISSKYHYEEIQCQEENNTSNNTSTNTSNDNSNNSPEEAEERRAIEQEQDESESEHCPICNFDLRTFSTEPEREAHVIECINIAEETQQHHTTDRSHDENEEVPEETEHHSLRCPTLQNRMLVYKVPTTSDKEQEFQECPICFEEMLPGEKVGRLECLCMYHYDCIRSWFKKKRKSTGTTEHRNFCPIHDAITI
ncbi:E3 ubiquitin-protein ligase PIB1 [Nakaseomyces bracarensis]|uniref:E3 ubiquitin-protein ligase PIB1 n=1 Tax=Nakaseomyces bracarensis TaxID=273131 RepID=A0ABR4NYE8_9SACH